jgi:glycosyltransferase involved in cell wall biosynthesis
MKGKICFVALGGYPLFTSNENLQYMGGAELMQVLVGNELAKKGYNVSFITLDEVGEKKKEYEKIAIIKTYSPSQNLTFFKKARLLWKSLKDSHSSVYIQSGGVPGLVALFCFFYKRQYIRWLASDKNVILEDIEKSTLYNKISMYLDIKFASLLIAQNDFQKQMVETRFKKRCIIIKNPIYIEKDGFKLGDNIVREKAVLWVGTIRSIKRPELYLRLAQLLPKYKFKMIGGKSDSNPQFYDPIKEEAKKIPNLEFLGFVPYHKIQKYYKEASILVNTSDAEGFPNTFLEGWINYIPIVSLNVDPDEIICKNNLGFHSKTFEQLIIDLDVLLNNDNLRNEMGKNGRKYIEENHDLEKIAAQFDELLTSFNN